MYYYLSSSQQTNQEVSISFFLIIQYFSQFLSLKGYSTPILAIVRYNLVLNENCGPPLVRKRKPIQRDQTANSIELDCLGDINIVDKDGIIREIAQFKRPKQLSLMQRIPSSLENSTYGDMSKESKDNHKTITFSREEVEDCMPMTSIQQP